MTRVVAGVLREPKTGMYFVARRAGNRAYRGCWEFPGGKVDAGETDEQALVREWEEEFGIDISGHVGVKMYDAPMTTKDLQGFTIAAYQVNDVPDIPDPGNSHDRTVWASSELVLSMDGTPSLHPILRVVDSWEEK